MRRSIPTNKSIGKNDLKPILTTVPRAPEKLSTADISPDEFEQLLDSIYSAAVEVGHWPHCLEIIRHHLHAEYASLFVRLPRGLDPGLSITVDRKNPNNPIVQSANATEHSPFAALAPDQIASNQDLMTDSEWSASAYYQERFAPYNVFHTMGVHIRIRKNEIFPLWVSRGREEGPFSIEDKRLCARLIPHIRRALNIQLSHERNRLVQDLCTGTVTDLMVGMLVLDKQTEVLDRNTVFDNFLQMKDGLRIVNGKLEAASPSENNQLQHLLRKLANESSASGLSTAMLVSRPSGKSNWSVLARPIRAGDWTRYSDQPAVAVFIRDHEGKTGPSIKLLHELFQLTPSESMLAIMLANGLAVEEAASALNIRITTARSQLQSIFMKTGIQRQSQLMRLLFSSVAILEK